MSGFDILHGVVFFLVLLVWTGMAAMSLTERRFRALAWSALLAVATVGVPVVCYLYIPSLFPQQVPVYVLLAGLLFVIFIIPVGRVTPLSMPGPLIRLDERDAIFHRFYRLEPGTPEYSAYYREHPEQEEEDNRIRRLPDLGHPGSGAYHPLSSPYAVALFDVLERNTREIDWPPFGLHAGPVSEDAVEMTRRIKGFARYLGADLVGVTRLKSHHVYSHIGRSPGPWGAPVELPHTYAVAVAAEMRFDMIRHAPRSPVLTETALRYTEVAKVAMVLARTMQVWGFKARAHVDGNYRVLCVPVAVDAGLGELGRLGLLVTPRYGPRVRLAVVTTDMPMIEDRPIVFGVQEFCAICRKCADNCPSGSIASGDKESVRGAVKWQSNQESCYTFWRRQGTDCSLCLRVCPYSHPDSPLHNLIRWSVRRNALVRRGAVLADDLFYGRRPRDRVPPPGWHGMD
jgi:ferredoxin